jgi:hypothetical protein
MVYASLSMYMCIRILPYAYRPGFLVVHCMPDASTRGCWVDRVLAGASISRGSPGLPLPLPYIYIYTLRVQRGRPQHHRAPAYSPRGFLSLRTPRASVYLADRHQRPRSPIAISARGRPTTIIALHLAPARRKPWPARPIPPKTSSTSP